MDCGKYKNYQLELAVLRWSGSCSLVCGSLGLGSSILSHSSWEQSLLGRQDPTFVVDTHGAEPAGVLGSRQSAAATPHTGKHLSSL